VAQESRTLCKIANEVYQSVPVDETKKNKMLPDLKSSVLMRPRAGTRRLLKTRSCNPVRFQPQNKIPEMAINYIVIISAKYPRDIDMFY